MKNFKKVFLTVILFVSVLLLASNVNAATIADLQFQITALIAQIQVLQQQLVQLQDGGDKTWCHTFNVNLKVGDSSSEVGYLKSLLQKENLLAQSITSNLFSEEIASAVIKLQEKYASEILAPYKLTRGTGYFGPSTRTKINKLYGCNNSTTCSMIYSPVCGVDGKNYGNECVLNSAGVLLAHNGLCENNINMSVNGTIIKGNLDGCGWLIKGDDNKYYEPINLSDNLKKEGLKTTFKFKKIENYASICMAGQIVEIIDYDIIVLMPTTESECLQKNGVWKTIGLNLVPLCNLKTTDFNKTCTDGGQCEGTCIGEKNIQSTTGKCSEWVITVGCNSIFTNGAINVICAD